VHVISMEFLRSLLRRRFARAQVATSRNVGCFLRLVIPLFQIEDAWDLSEKDRWRLYRRWVYDAQEDCYETIFQFQEMFDNLAEKLLDLRRKEDYEILKEADVVGMTTTGTRNHSELTPQYGKF